MYRRPVTVAATPRTDGRIAASEGSRRPGSRRRTGMLAAAVFLIVGIVLALLAWSKGDGPGDAFGQSDPGGTSVSLAHAQVGAVYTAGLTTRDLPSVSLVSARPLTTDGSAPAAMGLSYCTLKPGGYRIGAAIGELSEFCSEVASISGLDLAEVRRHRAILVLTVRPLAAGRVQVRGVDVTYRSGGETRTERIGPNVEIRP